MEIFELLNLAILFVLLFSAWVIFSGVFSVLYFSLGVLSCLTVVFFYNTMYKDKANKIMISAFYTVTYLLWLIKEITKSSLDVSLRMWKLDPAISPTISWIPVKFNDDVAFTIYANSITLTPGTVTIGTKKGMIYVHSLTEGCMEELKGGNMLNRVYKIIKSGEK